jgi:hypothetical protein
MVLSVHSGLFDRIPAKSANRVASLEKHVRALNQAFYKANKRIIVVSLFISSEAINSEDGRNNSGNNKKRSSG